MIMHMVRIHVVIDAAEREAFRAAAEREGTSLSEWIRAAGRERLERAQSRRLRTSEDLRRFFAELDQIRDDDGPEEDWEVTKQRIATSRAPDLPT